MAASSPFAFASWSIIQPAIVNSVKNTAANRYVGRGHVKRGLPYRQKSGSLPHIEKPMTATTATQNGRPLPAGVPWKCPPAGSGLPVWVAVEIGRAHV